MHRREEKNHRRCTEGTIKPDIREKSSNGDQLLGCMEVAERGKKEEEHCRRE